jgi:FkbM family methyltransferase
VSRVHLPPAQAWTFARLPELMAAHDITPWVLTHVGAHHGEEVEVYRDCGFSLIALVEPDPTSVQVLRGKFGGADDIAITEAAVTPQPDSGTALLHLAERSVWSGLQPHPTASGYTVAVPTIGINEVLRADDTNVLVLDTQGSELDLLRAAHLDELDMVIVETTRRAGDGAAFYDDAVSYMTFQGWRLAEEWVHDGSGYTDSVFVPA